MHRKQCNVLSPKCHSAHLAGGDAAPAGEGRARGDAVNTTFSGATVVMLLVLPGGEDQQRPDHGDERCARAEGREVTEDVYSILGFYL